MFSISLLVGQTKGVQALPADASGNPVAPNGNILVTGADDTIARKTNNTGDGLITNVTGIAPGSILFTATGTSQNGTVVSSQFQADVSAPAAPQLDHFNFQEVTPI